VDYGCTFAQSLHHVLLDFRRFDHYGFKFSLGYWQVQLITGLDIRRFFEHRHQFGQVEKLRKTSARTVSGAFGRKFNGRGRLTKGGCPRIKMCQPFLLQGVVLEIAHEGVHLGHAVAQGCTRCKNHATTSGDLIEVAAFSKHIGGFLRFRCAQSGHIPHLRI